VKRVSFPHEHGAGLLLIMGVAGAAVVAPRPLAVVGTGLTLAAGFVARDPLIKRAPGDPLLIATAALAFAIGVWLMPSPWNLILGASTAAVVLAHGLAVRWRRQRTAAFELLGMTGLGLAAGASAVAGGASPTSAMIYGAILAVHAAVTVPLVRTQIRPRERARAHAAEAAAAAVLGLAAGGFALAGIASAGLGLLPRAVHVAWRASKGVRPLRPALVGALESVLLAAAVVIAVVVATQG
jgi:hypothetical protein